MQPEVFGVEPQFQSQAGDHLALDPGAVVLDVLEQGRLGDDQAAGGQEALAGHPDRLALADALEAEHAVIEPLLTAIDAAAADPDYGYQRFGDVTGELATKLTAHLTHEENDGLALIDATLTTQQWQHFAQVHGQRLTGDASVYMPWLLNGASPQVQDTLMGKFPPPLLTAYREQWAPAYAALTIWPATSSDKGRRPRI